MTIYTVSPGDTIDSIALSHNISPERIAYVNQIPYPYSLAVGQSLLLTDAVNWERPQKAFGGYAYPFISPWVLNETLPFLTDLFVFSYGFTPEGALIPPQLDDTWMISAARASDTVPILTLTPFGPDGQFNNALISALLHYDEGRQTLIFNLTSLMQEKDFGGIDIDFEYILAADRLLFVDFVRQMHDAMAPLGFPVSVALAPKTSDDQPGLLYEGKDYALLGEAADTVLLMTYEWGYTYEHIRYMLYVKYKIPGNVYPFPGISLPSLPYLSITQLLNSFSYMVLIVPLPLQLKYASNRWVIFSCSLTVICTVPDASFCCPK